MITSLLKRPMAAVVAVLLWSGACLTAGWLANGWRLSADIVGMQYDHAKGVINAQRSERTAVLALLESERTTRERMEGLARDAKDETQTVAAAAGSMSLELDRLRVALRDSAAKQAAAVGAATAACGSGTQTIAAMVPAGVLNDMLRESAEAISILAEEVDLSNIGNKLCSGSYNLTREEQLKLKELLDQVK